MTKVKIDLEELVLSFGFDDEELATEYFSRKTGEIINIPRNVMKAAEGDLDEAELDEWERELISDAEAILEDLDDNYLVIPSIADSFFYNAMSNFTEEAVIDDKMKEKLGRALNSSHPMREFKRAVSNNSQVQDLWYEYEDRKSKEYVIEWLKSNKIDFEAV
jgi:hypothetical protein